MTLNKKTKTIVSLEERTKMMRNYVDYLKKLKSDNPEKAKEIAHNDLVRVGIIDEEGNLLYPYNGEEPREDDFSMGPDKIKSKKLIKKFK